MDACCLRSCARVRSLKKKKKKKKTVAHGVRREEETADGASTWNHRDCASNPSSGEHIWETSE